MREQGAGIRTASAMAQAVAKVVAVETNANMLEADIHRSEPGHRELLTVHPQKDSGHAIWNT